MMPGRLNLVYWAKVLSRFISVQLAVQALNFGCGLLLVRSLAKREYAYYTISMSMQGMLAILSECGTTMAVSAIGGKVWQDRHRLGQLINSALGFRNQLAAIGCGVIAPLMMWLLLQNGCSLKYALSLTALIITAGFLQLSVGTLLRVPLLHSQILQVQMLDLAWAGSRLACVIIAVGTQINAMLAAGATTIAYLIQKQQLVRLVKEKIDVTASPNTGDRQAMMGIFKSQIFNTLYYCAQGQIVVWMISCFGNTGAVAELGALARFGIINTLISSVMSAIVQPAFSRCQSRWRLSELYLQVVGCHGLFGCGLAGAVYLVPKPFLMLLGAQYQHLELELVLTMVGSAIMLVGSAMHTLNQAKGWLYLTWLYAPVTMVTQALLLLMIDVSHLRGAVLFGALTTLPSIILNVLAAQHGLRSME